MSDNDELHEALREVRDLDQVASACVIYEELLTSEDDENIESTLLYILDLLDLGDLPQATATLKRIDELCTGGVREYYLWTHGMVDEKYGRYAEAEKHLRKAHEMAPTKGSYLIEAASMAFRQGESAKAEYLVREALKCDCDRDEGLRNLGGYLAAQRRFVEARKALTESLKIDPGHEDSILWIEDLDQLIED